MTVSQDITPAETSPLFIIPPLSIILTNATDVLIIPDQELMTSDVQPEGMLPSTMSTEPADLAEVKSEEMS
ncbi:hypothetical protein D3C71_1909170 [compost metagenome]